MMLRALPWLRLEMVAAAVALLTACAGDSSSRAMPALAESGPWAGRILDTRTNRFVSRDELLRRAAGSRFVLLGEVHDNALHHQLQAEILQSMLSGGRTPSLAMEQFDREHQPALDSARAGGERDAERLAGAGRLDRKGWRWPDYKPLVELAVANNLRLLAANFSREDARALMKSGRPANGLDPAEPALRSALENDLVAGHCGIRPSAPVLAGMIEAQRARDAAMANTLAGAGDGGAVLIAGAGHTRRDRGVPLYMPPVLRENLLSVAFVEVEPSGTARQAGYTGLFDLVWFTPRAEREDPCASFRLPRAQ